MQFGLAHRAFEVEHQTIVEQRWMIDTVAIADEGIGETAKIEQTIPVGVVAGETGDLKAEHDADMTEGNLSGKAGEAVPFDDAISGKSEVFVDDHDLLQHQPSAAALETNAY